MDEISFNTSHVVVYHKCVDNVFRIYSFQYISCCSLSIFSDIGVPGAPEFQYISCCSLSIFAEQSQIGMVGFNTSHVVVYH